MIRLDHELTVPELLAKIEKLVGYVRIKTYAEGFEEGRKFESESREAKEDEKCTDLPKQLLQS